VNHLALTRKSLNCDGRKGVALLSCAALLLLPSFGGAPVRELLRYDRIAIAHGQLWRLLTAHVVHLDLRHAVLNILGLALMWALFAQDYRVREWCLIVLGAIAGIDLGLWYADSTVEWYVGSSGVLHGLMAAGTLAAVRSGQWEGWLLAAVLLGKLLYEHFAGALPLSGSDPVVVNAHLFGALGALAVALYLTMRRRRI
jgi:rhomboid family GlyGly-CTERM serine protease